MGIVDDVLNALFGIKRTILDQTGGLGIYKVFEIPLSTANTDKRFTYLGDQLIVTQFPTGNSAYIRLNDKRNDLIDLDIVRHINSDFNEFFLTNPTGSGTLKILAGSKGMFKTSIPLLVDIKSQDLSRVLTKIHYGGSEVSYGTSTNCPAGALTTLYSQTHDDGGALWYANCNLGPQNGSHEGHLILVIDGVTFPEYYTHEAMNNLGYDSNCRPVFLSKYGGADGYMRMGYTFAFPLVFDESIALKYSNASAHDVEVNWYIFYQAI